MNDLTLIIGNKNYSSWSLRPWLFMRKNALCFEEKIIWFDTPTFKDEVAPYGSNGTVPALFDGQRQVWDSLAIIEYLINTRELKYTWPKDGECLALARSMAAEMHSSYGALRNALSMDTRLNIAYEITDQNCQSDVDRIVYLWQRALHMKNAEGAWLFGQFSVVDAMFAPVIFRFNSYSVKVPLAIQSYMDFVLGDVDVKDWVHAARDEVVLQDH